MDYTSSADYGLCLISNHCLSYKYCCPNKIFEYIQAGLPVITYSGLVELSQIVRRHKVGYVLDTASVDSIVNFVLAKKTPQYIDEETKNFFCWEKQEPLLVESYD